MSDSFIRSSLRFLFEITASYCGYLYWTWYQSDGWKSLLYIACFFILLTMSYTLRAKIMVVKL